MVIMDNAPRHETDVLDITFGEPAKPDDYEEEIKDIQRKIILNKGRFVPDKFNAQAVIPTFQGEKPIAFGFLFLKDDYAEIMRIVDPEQQSKGIGSALLMQLEDLARRLGCTEIRSFIIADKPSAQRAFENAGYYVKRHDGDRILYAKVLE